MGAAFGVSFSYWGFASTFFYFLGTLFNTAVTLLQVFSLTVRLGVLQDTVSSALIVWCRATPWPATAYAC